MKRPAVLLALFLLAACTPEEARLVLPPEPATLSGTVTKGPVVGADIRVYRLTARGERGELLATTSTNDSGGWNLELAPEDDVRPLLVVATGGTYVDEAGAGEIDAGSMESLVVGASRTAVVTPLTQLVVNRMRQAVRNGLDRDVALDDARRQFSNRYGFDPMDTVPARHPDARQSRAARTSTALLGGLSYLAHANVALASFPAAARFAVVMAYARDLEDGVADGLDGAGDVISVRGTPLPVVPAADYATAINSYLAGIGITDFVAATNTGGRLLFDFSTGGNGGLCSRDSFFPTVAGTFTFITNTSSGDLGSEFAAGSYTATLDAAGKLQISGETTTLVFQFNSNDTLANCDTNAEAVYIGEFGYNAELVLDAGGNAATLSIVAATDLADNAVLDGTRAP